jgi:hypothetical protein
MVSQRVFRGDTLLTDDAPLTQRNHDPQASDDVFAFGVILWEMFSCTEYVKLRPRLSCLRL